MTEPAGEGRWQGARPLAALLAAGTIVRVVVAFAAKGVGYDIDSFALVEERLYTEPLDAYATDRWPYPPGYFPWIRIAGGLSRVTDSAFHGWIKLPAIAADAGLAVLVHWYLGTRGVSERRRLAAAALVAFGPSFAIVSGYHGQIDAVAILPAALAVVLWERWSQRPHRAVVSGLLIGVGIVVKTVPGFLLLALLPTRRSTREAATLVASAAVIPVLAVAPFVLHDLDAITGGLDYSGVPGVGGLSLLVQPSLADNWMIAAHRDVSDLSFRLWDASRFVLAAALLAATVVLVRRRPQPVEAAVMVWLVVYVANSNFFFQYAIWGLPFVLLANRVGAAAVAQALLVVPHVGALSRPWSESWLLVPYKVAMIGGWVAILVLMVAWGRRLGTVTVDPPGPPRTPWRTRAGATR